MAKQQLTDGVNLLLRNVTRLIRPHRRFAAIAAYCYIEYFPRNNRSFRQRNVVTHRLWQWQYIIMMKWRIHDRSFGSNETPRSHLPSLYTTTVYNAKLTKYCFHFFQITVVFMQKIISFWKTSSPDLPSPGKSPFPKSKSWIHPWCRHNENVARSCQLSDDLTTVA